MKCPRLTNKRGEALNKISSQDPTVVVEYSKELKQTILSGQGEQHINVVKWRLENEFKVQIELFSPKIPYRETITKAATISPTRSTPFGEKRKKAIRGKIKPPTTFHRN